MIPRKVFSYPYVEDNWQISLRAMSPVEFCYWVPQGIINLIEFNLKLFVDRLKTTF